MFKSLHLSSDCFTDNHNWYGSDLPKVNCGIPKVESAQDCQAICKQVPNCNFFAYDKQNKICTFKPTHADQPNPTFISGPKACPSREIVVQPTTTTNITRAATNCFADSHNWYGWDIPTVDCGIQNVASAFDCQAICQKVPDCNCFAYDKVNKLCTFKPFCYADQPNPNFTSGPRNCP